MTSPARRSRKQTTKPKPVSSDVESSDGGSVTRCVCGEQHNVGLMVQCESCEVWQHCDCIGMGENDLPDHYYCDQCQPTQHSAPKPHGRSKRSYSLSSTNDPDTPKPESPAESRPKRQKRVNTPPTPTLISNSNSTATSTSSTSIISTPNASTNSTSRKSSRRASTLSDHPLTESPTSQSMSEMIQDSITATTDTAMPMAMTIAMGTGTVQPLLFAQIPITIPTATSPTTLSASASATASSATAIDSASASTADITTIATSSSKITATSASTATVAAPCPPPAPSSNESERQTRSRKSARAEEGGPEEKLMDPLPPTSRKRKNAQDSAAAVRKRSSVSSATSTNNNNDTNGSACDEKPPTKQTTATGRQRKARKLSQTEIAVEVAAYWDANGRPIRATSPPAKSKKPSPKMTFVDMNKRVSSILAYITKKEQEAKIPVASQDTNKECRTKPKKTKATKQQSAKSTKAAKQTSNYVSHKDKEPLGLAVLTNTFNSVHSVAFDQVRPTSPSSPPELSASSTCSDPSSVGSGQSVGPMMSPRDVMGLLSRENDSIEYHDSRRHSTSSTSTLSSESTIPFINDASLSLLSSEEEEASNNNCYLDVHAKDNLLECSCLIHPAMYSTHICPSNSNNLTSTATATATANSTTTPVEHMSQIHLDRLSFDISRSVRVESSCDIMRKVRGLIDKFQRTYTGFV
ncbi:hypothetical protein J3Q64DRAFT_1736070 [Phycomyces blakesleeanus]|uniref:Zinc finger PHD-type domain-containing protein n=1 Tax=Phycomyces blakesleeanus TaxID=4837 RepID=A0ABR3B0G4_PHYBL